MLVPLSESGRRLEDTHVSQAAKGFINFRLICSCFLPAQILTRLSLAPLANLFGSLLFEPPGWGKVACREEHCKDFGLDLRETRHRRHTE